MKAMVLPQTCDLDQSDEPLVLQEWSDPEPKPDEILMNKKGRKT